MRYITLHIWFFIWSFNILAESSDLGRFEAVISSDKTITAMAQEIFNDIAPAEIQEKIHRFITTHSIPIKRIQSGETFNDLRKTLGIAMETDRIPGTDYSFEQFRGIDKDFKETTIQEMLTFFELSPVKWLTTGTVGFRSDIDNVAEGEDFSAIIAKLLHDTLNVYIYGTTSGRAFDTEVYTQHLGASQKTSLSLETKAAEEKYLQIALFNSLFQLFNQTKDSTILSWETIKNQFKKDLGNKFDTVFAQIESLRESYQAEKNLEKGVEDEDLAELRGNSQAILKISNEIKVMQKKIDVLKADIDAFYDNKKHATAQAPTYLKKVKEREQLLVDQALLYGIRGTFFPESYISEEAFQYSVISDAAGSQRLQMLIKDYRKKTSLPSDLATQCIASILVDENNDSIVKNTPLINIINLTEQIAYFIHRLDKDGTNSDKLVDASKYLDRYLESLLMFYDQLKKDKFRIHADSRDEARSKKIAEIYSINKALLSIKRGIIPVSREYIFNNLSSAFKRVLDNATIDGLKPQQVDTPYITEKIITTLTDFIDGKIVNSPSPVPEKIQRLTKLFSFGGKLPLTNLVSDALQAKLNIRLKDKTLISDDEEFTVFLNTLLGQNTVDNPIVSKNFEKITKDIVQQLPIDDFDDTVKTIIDSYFEAYKVYFNHSK